MSATTFPAFLNLPSELRLKIWTYLLPGPRILPIRFSRTTQSYITPSAPPALLSVSSETRSLFLSHYTLLQLNPNYDSTIYIDFALDTLFFEHEDCSPGGDLAADLRICEFRDRIERVAIDAHLWEILRLFRYDALSEIRCLTGLKNVALVLRRGDEDADEGLGYFTGNEIRFERCLQSQDRLRRMFFEGPGTVEQEISQCRWYVSTVKWELDHGSGFEWKNGEPPAVQMWLR